MSEEAKTLPPMCAIEFPGYLKDPNDPSLALKALGGEKVIAQAELNVSVNLHPNDPVARSSLRLRRERIEQNNTFLLSVSSDSFPDGSESVRDAEFVGRIRSTFTQNGPSDLCYFNSVEVVRPKYNEPYDFSETLEPFPTTALSFGDEIAFPPVTFISAIPQNPMSHVQMAPQTKKGQNTEAIHISIDEVPPSGPRCSLPESIKNCPKFERIKKLFETQPIWSLLNLAQASGVSSRDYLLRALRQVAFTYSSGPWRTLYVRFGYNPKKDRNAAKYQLLVIPLSASIQDDILAQAREEKMESFRFGSATAIRVETPNGPLLMPAVKELRIPFYTLPFPKFQEIVDKNIANDFKVVSGWIKNSCLTELKKLGRSLICETLGVIDQGKGKLSSRKNKLSLSAHQVVMVNSVPRAADGFVEK